MILTLPILNKDSLPSLRQFPSRTMTIASTYSAGLWVVSERWMVWRVLCGLTSDRPGLSPLAPVEGRKGWWRVDRWMMRRSCHQHYSCMTAAVYQHPALHKPPTAVGGLHCLGRCWREVLACRARQEKPVSQYSQHHGLFEGKRSEKEAV
jgi:hypothetical protein